ALVERCYRVWHSKESMYLHYRNDIGLEERVPIMAARSLQTAEGNVLVLWVRRPPEESEMEIDIGDEDDEADHD
ncbi:MAG: hypothetical protein ROW39_02080, partial [Anaerolineaceae bacterium]